MDSASRHSTLAIERENVGGATLLLIEDHSLPVVRFLITVRPASLADPADHAGLTRVMMELSMRGTKRHPRESFNRALEEMGSSLSAVTGMETAMWRGITLKRHLQPTLALLGEAMAEPALAADEMQPLVDEMVEGLRADRDDDETLAEVFLRRALFGSHLLGRSPQGEVASLKRLTAHGVRDGHAHRIVPGGIVAAVAGDLTLAEARQALGALVASLPRHNPISVVVPPVTPSDELTILLVDKPERTQAQLRVARPGLPGTHSDALAFWLGVMAFGGTFTSPFTHEVRDVRGWSYGAHAAFDRLSGLPSPMVMRSAPAINDAVDCLALELALYGALARGELAGDILEFARSYVRNRYPLEIATSSDQLLAALRYELLGLPPAAAFTFPEDLARLDLGSVGPAMQRHLHPTAATVVVVATASQIEPRLKARFPAAELGVVDFKEGLGF